MDQKLELRKGLEALKALNWNGETYMAFSNLIKVWPQVILRDEDGRLKIKPFDSSLPAEKICGISFAHLKISCCEERNFKRSGIENIPKGMALFSVQDMRFIYNEQRNINKVLEILNVFGVKTDPISHSDFYFAAGNEATTLVQTVSMREGMIGKPDISVANLRLCLI